MTNEECQSMADFLNEAFSDDENRLVLRLPNRRKKESSVIIRHSKFEDVIAAMSHEERTSMAEFLHEAFPNVENGLVLIIPRLVLRLNRHK